jgi:hypothetical protein
MNAVPPISPRHLRSILDMPPEVRAAYDEQRIEDREALGFFIGLRNAIIATALGIGFALGMAGVSPLSVIL